MKTTSIKADTQSDTWYKYLKLRAACKTRLRPNQRTERRICRVLFLPRTICNLLFGESHAFYHRVVIGLLIAAIGVFFDKYCDGFKITLVQYCGNIFGMGLHGIGISPITERMAKTTAK